MSSIMRRRNGLMASSVMGMLLSDVRLATPHLQTGRAHPDTGRAACRSALPRERFSPLARFGHGAMSDLSPLSGAERKLDFGAVRAAFDPERTSDFGQGEVGFAQILTGR